VLVLPDVEIEAWVGSRILTPQSEATHLPNVTRYASRTYIAILTMLPHGILITPHINVRADHRGKTTRLPTYPSEIIQPQSQEPGVREPIHDQEPIIEESPDVWEVQHDMAVRFSLRRLYDVGLYACDGRRGSSGFAVVESPLEAAGAAGFGDFFVGGGFAGFIELVGLG